MARSPYNVEPHPGLCSWGGWVAWDAMLKVGVATIAAIAGLTGTALLLVNRENRTEIWNGIKNTVDDDLNRIQKYFKIKR